MLKEFKEFAMRGNVIDLAIGVVIGAAFGKIVTSFVNDILMPPIGLLLGKVKFTDLYIVLRGSVPEGTALEVAKTMEGVITWNYGAFLSTIIDFILIAFAIFLLVKAINNMKRQPAPAAPAPATTKECIFCHSTVHIKATRCPNCTSQL